MYFYKLFSNLNDSMNFKLLLLPPEEQTVTIHRYANQGIHVIFDSLGDSLQKGNIGVVPEFSNVFVKHVVIV